MSEKGVVLKSTGSWYVVEKEDLSIIECRMSGKFRLDGLPTTNPIAVGDEVDLIISHITEVGINVIINDIHKGLLYKDQVYDDIRTGDRMTGYIKAIRPDNKIDVSLQKLGYENIEPNAEKILDELRASRGFLRLNDNSNPEDIKTVLKMSKKTFKKAIGSLYKDKLIEIKDDGIYLVTA